MEKRSSYFSYIQFYVVLIAVFYKLYELFKSQTMPDFNTIGLIILVPILYRIKFFQVIQNQILITSPLARRVCINKSDIKEVKRVYSQVCVLKLVDGTKVFFMQKFFHAINDVFFQKDKYLNDIL